MATLETNKKALLEIKKLIPSVESLKIKSFNFYEYSAFITFTFQTKFYSGEFNYSENKGTRNSLTIFENKIK